MMPEALVGTRNFKFWTRHLCTLGNFCRALLRKNQEPRDSETKRLRSKETRVQEFKSARNFKVGVERG